MADVPEDGARRKKLSNLHSRVKSTVSGFFSHPESIPCEQLPQKYSYIFRKKSRWELTRISVTVVGIEFCYAVETAFVTPVLLSLGLSMKYVSMIWCLSPLLAFVWTPILGSISDSCRSRFGRRRPFIFLLSTGIIIGLVLIPYGGRLGVLLGDDPRAIIEKVNADRHNVSGNFDSVNRTEITKHTLVRSNKTEMLSKNKIFVAVFENSTGFKENGDTMLPASGNISQHTEHFDTVNKTLNEDNLEVNTRVFGIILTVLGTVFLDFCADVCQSPCRAYLLDITLPEEQPAALTIFCLNSGVGSAVGYGIAAIKWNISLWGNILEGHVIVSFAFITILYVLLVSTSLYSFPEIPLPLLDDPSMSKEYQELKRKDETKNNTEMSVLPKNQSEYSSTKENGYQVSLNGNNSQGKEVTGISCDNNSRVEPTKDSAAEKESPSNHISLRGYLKSIIFMPKSIRILCLTNFFYGMGVVSYTIFFTDFVGECVFSGDPQAPKESRSYELYKDGVRFGCWGMMFSSISCAVYSYFVEDLAKRFGAKPVFVGGALVYSVGMILMGVTRDKTAVIVLCATAGIMLSTLSTLPYILIAHYHSSQKFQEYGEEGDNSCARGVGTDIATVISMIVLSQCILSFSMGAVVETIGSNIVVMGSAALFSACGAISATQVMYLDM